MKANMISAAEIIAICDELDRLYEEYNAAEDCDWYYSSSHGAEVEAEYEKKIDDLERILEEYENG